MKILPIALIKTKTAMALTVFMVIIISVFYYHRASNTYDIQCESYVAYRAQQSDTGFDMAIAMNMHHNAKGEFVIEGTMGKKNQTWSINRDITFNYARLHNNTIKMDHINIVKYGRDNVPDDMFNDIFLSTAGTSGRIITLSKVLNGYLVGNLRAPAFICLPR